ncbi:NAD-dependent epimerase [Phyllobacterium brassicacearum]|uniref:NAD-dependent epimerase n=1 Tax=Phyllobacterium brassicacearum TaxID=314235 RepID=A0A2P7BNT0_9HYPH|nr:SDR family oxidoreductase [Phyllobacterium brassicacearum]PSH68124.1 NAD-dependent epimerase [Phyllobacterium brassicacearum]TDQ29649.1 nucleoside-diphosphate-sugar epimerase [Phyllobacterium brassicacearum]
MKIMITGNMGYIGPVVTSHLRKIFPEATLIGVDSGLFAHCLTNSYLPETITDIQIFRDVRDLTADMFDGVDAVVHLAAVSNDPMGSRFEDVTEEINQRATIRVAALAAEKNVARFVFASSCSMYGYAEGGARTEGDDLNPLTAYARSKVGAEKGLEQVSADSQMIVTALRFATACGFSSRTRLDLVLNDFVASALATGRVSVLSDGTPWRPLIHVSDMARAIEWAIVRPASHGRFLAVNAGSEVWNYQVAELAAAVQAAMPGVEVEINRNAQPDKRSYRVDFSLFKSLAPNHQPQVMLKEAIENLRDGLTAVKFNSPADRPSSLVRFNVLGELLEEGALQPDLRWVTENHDAENVERIAVNAA